MTSDLTIPLTAALIGFAVWAVIHEWRLWKEFLADWEGDKKMLQNPNEATHD